MRSFAFGRSIAATLIATVTALVCTAAGAGELLVIPYACRMAGGEPVLTPAQDQGHRIIGRREERDFTECSPVNPDMCRRWKLYRFDVDCAGQRVPWVSLSAAADAQRGGRSWVENGRMRLGMPPSWSMTPDDPCSTRARFGWRDGALSRYCADRRDMAQSDVEMPAGFAPMLELDAIFVADETPAPEPGAIAAPALAERPAPKTASLETPPPPREVEKPVKAPTAPPVATSAPTPPPPIHARPDKAPPTPPATEKAAAADTPVTPTIINGPNAPSAKTEPEQPAQVASAPPETTAALADSKDSPAMVADEETSKEPTPNAEPAPVAEQGDFKSIVVTLVDGLQKSLGPTTLLGLGGLTMLGLLALVFAFRRDPAQPDFALARDIASVSLDGQADGRESAGRWLTTVEHPSRSPEPFAPQRSRPPASLDDAIPQTRGEALQVLGMGVAPEANETAIKKIVDGLRLSWHPDHASNPQDKDLRELRTKQINAAWDIIVGLRSS